jgi:hypothetical protein
MVGITIMEANLYPEEPIPISFVTKVLSAHKMERKNSAVA